MEAFSNKENTTLTSRRVQNDFDWLRVWTPQQLQGSVQLCDPRFRFLDPLVGALALPPGEGSRASQTCPWPSAKPLATRTKLWDLDPDQRQRVQSGWTSTLLFAITFWCTFFCVFSGFDGAGVENWASPSSATSRMVGVVPMRIRFHTALEISSSNFHPFRGIQD